MMAVIIGDRQMNGQQFQQTQDDTAGPRKWLLTIVCSSVVLVILFAVLRITSRRLMRQKIWWDDYLILITVVCYVTAHSMSGVMLWLGVGLHISQVSASQFAAIGKIYLALQILYNWLIMMPKLSILLMYYRIFEIVPYFRPAASFIVVLIFLTALTFSFMYPLSCTPLEKMWTSDIEGHCIDPVLLWVINASLNMLADILTLCLPLPQVWQLPLKTVEKLAVSTTFALGGFVVFSAGYRIYALLGYDRADVTYTILPIYGWSVIDAFAAILSACLPVMKPVLLYTLVKLRLRGENGLAAKCRSVHASQRGTKNSEVTTAESMSRIIYRGDLTEKDNGQLNSINISLKYDDLSEFRIMTPVGDPEQPVTPGVERQTYPLDTMGGTRNKDYLEDSDG